MPRPPAKKKRARPVRRRPRRQFKARPKRALTSIPEHMTCRLIYAVPQMGTTVTSTPGSWTGYFNPYDILNNSSYAQPRFWDQMAVLYEKYRVNGLGWEIDCAALTGTSYFAIGCFPHNYMPPLSNLKAFREDPRYKIYITSLNRGPLKIRGYRSLASVEDMTKSAVRNDDMYNAATNASVTNKAQIRITWQALDEATSYNHWIQAKLIFYITFYQLKLPAAS